jgi:DnaJ-class molecular chaperone
VPIRDALSLQEPNAGLSLAVVAGGDRGTPERSSTTPCPVCGGSGSLRLSDQRYRTCLDCLGTGSAA